jgi:predicted kinase
VLRYPAGALVAIGGPPGAGKSTLAARAVGARVPVLDPDDVRARDGGEWGDALRTWRAELEGALRSGSGAVAVTTGLREGHRLAMTRAAAAAGVEAHLVLIDAADDECRAGRAAQGEEKIAEGLFEHLLHEWGALRRTLENGDPAGDFAPVVIADRAAAARLRRITVSRLT